MDTGIISIIVAIISAIATIVSVLVSNNKARLETDAKLDKALAVQETKLEALTREVREHNSYFSKIPIIEEQIRVINHRIADLEQYHK